MQNGPCAPIRCVLPGRQLPRGQRRWPRRTGRTHWERARARACRLAAGASRSSRGERRPWSSNPLARESLALAAHHTPPFLSARRWLAGARRRREDLPAPVWHFGSRTFAGCFEPEIGARSATVAIGYTVASIAGCRRRTWPTRSKLSTSHESTIENALGNGMHELEGCNATVSVCAPAKEKCGK